MIALPLLAALVVPAMTPRVYCPLLLDEDAVTVTRAPAGWVGTAHAAMRLSSGGILRGHPDDKGYLVPKSGTGKKAQGTTTWAFEPGEERWLWCGYGGSGSVQLAKRLPDAAGDCTTAFRDDRFGQIAELYAVCVAPVLPRSR